VATLGDPIRYSETFDVPPAELMRAVRSNGLEGVVAKRLGSPYKPGDRSGDGVKVRANKAQELVVGGSIPASNTFDSILVGYYSGRALMYASRIRSGFSPASRLKLSRGSPRYSPTSAHSGICPTEARGGGAKG
jgi:bifunctional non-homologous end joining protein LigD